MFRKIFPFVFSILLIGCSPAAKITGEIKDDFGKPVSGATVKVQGTTFTAQSGSSGKYSVQYVPGNVTVQLTKAGYSTAEFSATINNPAEYPAEPITLHQIPQSSGVWLYGDSSFIELHPSRVTSQHVLENPPDGVPSQDHYYVDFQKAVSIDKRQVRFADTTGRDIVLLRLYPAGEVMAAMNGFAHGQNRPMQLIRDGIRKQGSLTIREANLSPGDYAYVWVQEDPELFFRQVPIGPGYPFHVR